MRDPGNHFYLKNIPIEGRSSSKGLPLQAPEADPQFALSRFCFPYDPPGFALQTTNVADTFGFDRKVMAAGHTTRVHASALACRVM